MKSNIRLNNIVGKGYIIAAGVQTTTPLHPCREKNGEKMMLGGGERTSVHRLKSIIRSYYYSRLRLRSTDRVQ